MITKYFIYLLAGLSIFLYSDLSEAQNITLYTPRGSVVYGNYRNEFSPAQVELYTTETRKSYPHATVLANASQTYNCHSHAWYLTSGGSNNCWINQTGGISNYWNDNSYTATTEGLAEKIFYYNGDHSAIKSSVAGKYDSKWGSGPLMRHDPNYGPPDYKMNNRRYYTRNVRVTGGILPLTGSTVSITNPGTFRTSTVWTCSSNLQLSGSTNTSAFIKATWDNEGWVQASFNGYTTRTYVYMGKPNITGITGPTDAPYRQESIYIPVHSDYAGVTSYEWRLTPQNNNYMWQDRNRCYITFNNTGVYDLEVRATNTQGTGQWKVLDVMVYGSYKAYPNPASNAIYVDLGEAGPFISKKNGKDAINITLYNNQSKVAKQTAANGGQVSIDVSDLTNGIYYLDVDDGSGKTREMQKIIVNH